MDAFKKCPCCTRVWSTRAEFLSDRTIELIGYQVNFGALELGLLLFNHEACRSTLAVHARQFSDLYEGPTFQQRRTGLEDCPRFCLRQDELEACAAECECAFIREIFQTVRQWPKNGN